MEGEDERKVVQFHSYRRRVTSRIKIDPEKVMVIIIENDAIGDREWTPTVADSLEEYVRAVRSGYYGNGSVELMETHNGNKLTILAGSYILDSEMLKKDAIHGIEVLHNLDRTTAPKEESDGLNKERSKTLSDLSQHQMIGEAEPEHAKEDCTMEEIYIGTKVIAAEPMDENCFLHNIKKQEPPEGFVNREGYCVRYEDGYRSWSPKETFERAYRKMTDQEKGMVDLSLPGAPTTKIEPDHLHQVYKPGEEPKDMNRDPAD